MSSDISVSNKVCHAASEFGYECRRGGLAPCLLLVLLWPPSGGFVYSYLCLSLVPAV